MAVIVRSRDSLLTTSSGFSNYRGILNLVIILLVLSNARAALENVIKYGILVDPFSWFHFFRGASSQQHWPALLIALGLSAHITVSLVTEKLIAKLWLAQAQVRNTSKRTTTNGKSTGGSTIELASSSILQVAHVIIALNLFLCIAVPPVAIYTHDTHPISISGSLMLVSIVFLKLVSYHMINFWCRDLREPEQLQKRTTKSFLRSYTPPVVDFAATCAPIKEEKDTCSLAGGQRAQTPVVASGQQVAVTAKSTDSGSKTKESPITNGDLRQRLNVNNSASANNKQLAPKLDSQKSSPNSTRSSSCERQLSVTRKVALEVLAKYPENITIQDMCSYMMFPTLCYELEYARTERIRKRFLIKRVVELIILSQLDMALIQQWIIPTVSNSVLPFRQMQFSHMLERLLKLAIPNHVIWLIWFYLFFHSLLNIIAELTRFADREFYRDWWNSESVNYFWSNWNIPVHKWCLRHLYYPLISLGLTRCQASTAVFFVSAFFHEYLVSVPLKLFRMWAFTGMLMQLPWSRFVSLYFNNHFANVAVWVSLIIGQPLCILMYYHDYYVINNAKQLPS